jgi:hypothetical protein
MNIICNIAYFQKVIFFEFSYVLYYRSYYYRVVNNFNQQDFAKLHVFVQYVVKFCNKI